LLERACRRSRFGRHSAKVAWRKDGNEQRPLEFAVSRVSTAAAGTGMDNATALLAVLQGTRRHR
jgi:hypothetical protein